MSNGKFEEIKIKMVMKLKGLSHEKAIEEIARIQGEKKKAEEEESHESPDIGRNRMMAEDFFEAP